MVMMKKSKYLISLLLMVLLIGVGLNKFYSQNRIKKDQWAPTQATVSQKPGAETETKNEIPQKVYAVLRYVELHHKPMKGYVGGREFKNREKHLPFFTPENKPVSYREWDVNPKIEHQNRGTERLITGNDQSAWYTANHYQSFTKIK